jgi:hypothetical protein
LAAEEIKLGSNRIQLGEALDFEAKIYSQAKTTQRLAIDFAIHHRKANGKLSPKVFKWKETKLEAGERLTIGKKHPIRKINTRAYYSGSHQLDLIINGKTRASVEFHLDCAD